MSSDHPAIQRVKDSLTAYEVQILYTQIDTSDQGDVIFKDYSFQVDEDVYFYPASTVKLPMAVLAAEYADGHDELSLDIPYVTDRDTSTHTIAEDIQQIFTVSDNEAYNRLYEILGRDYVNDRLREKGIVSTRIAHRLSTPGANNPKRATVKMYPGYDKETIILDNNPDGKVAPLDLKKINKGTAFMKDGKLINKPMNFSLKNHFPLEAQHGLMKRLIFPDKFSKQERFTLTDETRERLLMSMQLLPKEAGYSTDDYYDSYVKFFLFGDSKEDIPEHITIYNKVGYAYGTLTETAYIVDSDKGIRFLLSASILVNKNQTFNDDNYEYEEIGIPFLAQLGREVLNIEYERQ